MNANYVTRELAGLSLTRDGEDFVVPSGGRVFHVSTRRPDVAQLVQSGVLVPKSPRQLATRGERKPGAFTVAQVHQLADLIGDALEGHDRKRRQVPAGHPALDRARAAIARADQALAGGS